MLQDRACKLADEVLVEFLGLLCCASFCWRWFGSAETVVKILHVNPVPEVLEIWQAAAVEFEKVHPPIKVLLLETPKSNFPPEPLPERLYSAKI